MVATYNIGSVYMHCRTKKGQASQYKCSELTNGTLAAHIHEVWMRINIFINRCDIYLGRIFRVDTCFL